MIRSLLGLLFGVALFSSSPAAQYPDEAHSTKTVVTVRVIWVASFKQVSAFCYWLSSQPNAGDILGCFEPSTNTIIAVQPTNFNDYPHLAILGHEFWHALGASHPE